MNLFKVRHDNSQLTVKILWTILVVFVYMVGRTIPVFTVQFNSTILQETKFSTVLNTLASVTGGQLSSLTLFSLGLSPWMSAQIIWRFFTVINLFKGLTASQLDRYQMFLSLLIAFIQSFGLTSTVTFLNIPGINANNQIIARMITIIIMIAGAFALTWLGKMNTLKGLGGPTVIILVNMLLSFYNNLSKFFSSTNLTSSMFVIQIIIFVLAVGLLTMMSIITYRAEYRIPISRISIHNSFSESSYIPIRINPAAGMPFMYAMTLMILPPIMIQGLLSLFPKQSFLVYLSSNVSITTLPGVIIYIILLAVLAIGFAYYNYDAAEIAKSMRRNGDYIEHIRPGLETQKYIQSYVSKLSLIGAVIVAFMGGVPLLFTIGKSNITNLALLISNVFIVASLTLGIVEQVDILKLWKKYDRII